MPQPSLLSTIIGSVVADGIALAVAFGVSITGAQQAAILGFVGIVTTGITLAVAYLHGQHASGSQAAAITGTLAKKPAGK